jgi:hypothetical protein
MEKDCCSRGWLERLERMELEILAETERKVE